MEMEKKLSPIILKEDFFKKKSSFLSRIGSGSACRSIYTGLSVWGKHKNIVGSNNLYSIPYPYYVHPIFKNMQNTILIVDEKSKIISSSMGHYLMINHPYAKKKFQSSFKNMNKLIHILKKGKIKKFGKIVEHEALNLHAMMMTSNPYYMCIKPNTLSIIYSLWDFRLKNDVSIYFTLDAGANVHILYPKKERKNFLKWIQKNNIISLCKKIIENFCL